MKKKIIALFTSFLLMIPVFTISVNAEEDPTLYWDGIYYSNEDSVVLEDGFDTSLWNSAQRVKFSVRPTHSILQTYTNYSTVYLALYYYWYLGDSNTSDLSTYQTYFNDTLKPALSSSVLQSVTGSSNVINTSVYNTNNFSLNEICYENRYYYVVSTKINIYYAVRAGHIGFTTSNLNPFLLAANLADRNTNHYVSSAIIFNEVDNTGYSKNTLYTWFNNDEHPVDRFSTKVKNLMTGGVVLPSGGTVTNPDPDPEPSADPSADPSDPSGGSSSSSLSQQQQQQIAEGAVQVTNSSTIESDAVTVNVSDGITEETVQRLDQTLQNNNPYQTTFSTAVQTIDGFRQIGVKFAQTSEAFLDFLPSWVTDLLALMFVLLFFFIVLRLLKVFHG